MESGAVHLAVNGSSPPPLQETEMVPRKAARSSGHRANRASLSDGRRTKRHKIALACEECRARKVRCDGILPSRSLAHMEWSLSLSGVCYSFFCTELSCTHLILQSVERARDVEANLPNVPFIQRNLVTMFHLRNPGPLSNANRLAGADSKANTSADM
jgi:hypothetical protein